MKRLSAILILAIGVSMMSYAQEDDVYFVPTKARKEAEAKSLQEQRQRQFQSDYEYIQSQNAGSLVTAGDDDNWAKGRVSHRNVDEYNRRQMSSDTTYVAPESDEDGLYTSRIIRFHSPRLGVVVSSPYYGMWVDYYDPWLSPWDFDYYYDTWYGWGWNPYFYHSSFYWRPGWYDPWWSYSWGWGWHPGWHDHWHGIGWNPRPGGGRFLDTSRRATAYRPSRSYISSGRYIGNASSRPSSNVAIRSNRRYESQSGVANRPETRPSRSFGNSNQTRSNTSSPSMTSRSFGNVGAGRSFGNTGGGRSFGNSGGGRSFGGRR